MKTDVRAAHEHALTVWAKRTGEDITAPEYQSSLAAAVKHALAWIGGRSTRIIWPSYRNFKTTEAMWIPWAQAVADWDQFGCYDFRAHATTPWIHARRAANEPIMPHVVYAADEPDMIEAEWRDGPLPGSVPLAGFGDISASAQQSPMVDADGERMGHHERHYRKVTRPERRATRPASRPLRATERRPEPEAPKRQPKAPGMFGRFLKQLNDCMGPQIVIDR